MGQLISWEQGPDGCIYMVRSGFERNAAVYLTRFRPNDIGNRAAWQHYDNGSRGESYFPILDQKVRVSREITADWNAIKPATVVIAGRGGWQTEQDEENFTQLYGGYITPGSVLDSL